MEKKEKQELIEKLNDYITLLKNSYSKELNNMKIFNAICYYDPSDEKPHICEVRFNSFFNNLSSNDIVTPEVEALLSKKFDRKSLIKILNITVTDERVVFDIKNALLNYKNINGKIYQAPKNGDTFFELFKKLDNDLASAKKNSTNVFERANKEANIKAIIKLLKNVILKEFQIVNLSLKYLNGSINVFEEMITLLKEDKYMRFTSDKKRCIYEFLSLTEKEKNDIDKIVRYNNNLRVEAINNNPNYERLDTLEYKKILENMIRDIKTRKKSFCEYFRHVNIIYDCNDISLQKSLRNVRKNWRFSESVSYVLDSMLKEDPNYEVFSRAISDTLGLVTPLTKRVIKKPTNLNDILEILDCYDEILSNEDNNTIKAKKVKVILEEIASEIIDVYKKCRITYNKINISLVELNNIYESIINKRRISLINEEGYVNSALGIEDDDEDEMRFYILNQIRSIKEYNRLYDLKKIRSNARRKRTEVYNKLQNDDLETASALLKKRVEKNKDNKELLVLLEQAFDEGIDGYIGDDVNYYHDLCRLSIDCTHYMRNCGIAYSDGDELRVEINKMNN